jgi:hypothetical protein
MTKTCNDEAYEKGVKDGKGGNPIGDFYESVSKIFDSTPEDEIYRKGYDYGVEHRHDSNPDSPFNDGDTDNNCFLTTACTKAKGLPDDCQELKLLRSCRDEYIILNLSTGGSEIQEYYKISPLIVRKIKLEANSTQIFTNIYQDLIIPCIKFIEKDQNWEAYNLYRNYVLQLKEKYLEVRI